MQALKEWGKPKQGNYKARIAGASSRVQTLIQNLGTSSDRTGLLAAERDLDQLLDE